MTQRLITVEEMLPVEGKTFVPTAKIRIITIRRARGANKHFGNVNNMMIGISQNLRLVYTPNMSALTSNCNNSAKKYHLKI